ncbi:MAG: OmpA family protein [Ignavibacteria bacterium]|nr:OmpA family protein [Ignavibacteria bacterium]
MVFRFFAWLFLILLGVNTSRAQSYGFYFGIGLNRLEGDFRQFRELQDSIPLIGSGASLCYSLGAFSISPISKGVQLRNSIGIQFYSLDVTAFRDMSARFDTSIPQPRYILTMDGKFRYNSLKVTYAPNVMVKVINNLFFDGGLTIGYEILSPKNLDYTQVSYYKGGSFVTEKFQFRTEGRHKFPISFTFDIGLSYNFPKNLFGLFKVGFSPRFSFGFTNISKDFISDILQISLNINIYPEIIKKVKKPSEQIKFPPIDSLLPQPIEPTQIVEKVDELRNDSIIIDYVGISFQKGHPKYVPANILVTKEIYETKAPLLNYVFFDYAKAELQPRYSSLRSISEFNFASLRDKSILEVYDNILNIIGFRLRQKPNSTITLIGCNSDVGEEKGNLQLSRRRANSIAKYLTQVWEIEPNRIKIEERNLPSNPSNPKIPEGNSENQRVEIFSEDPEILSPFVLLDTSLVVFPDFIRIYTKTQSKEHIPTIKLINPLSPFDTITKKIKNPIDSIDLSTSTLLNNYKVIPQIIDIMIIYSFEDYINSSKVLGISLPVVFRESNKISPNIEKFIIPPFDFNSSELNTAQISFFYQFKDKIFKAKKITLVGHTDIIGPKDYNINLSRARVETVSKFLKKLLMGTLDQFNKSEEKELDIQIRKEAYGETNPPFDNKHPVGRFYSRTVEVILEY